jgi:hypothetical protein
MRATSVLRVLLALQHTRVIGFEFDGDGLIIDVAPTWRIARCGDCKRPVRACYDGRERRWRHLDVAGIMVHLRCRIRRVRCERCGVVVEHVPWAEPASRFTWPMEMHVAYHTQRTDRTTVTTLLRVAWRTVGSIVRRYVHRQQQREGERLYRVDRRDLGHPLAPGLFALAPSFLQLRHRLLGRFARSFTQVLLAHHDSLRLTTAGRGAYHHRMIRGKKVFIGPLVACMAGVFGVASVHGAQSSTCTITNGTCDVVFEGGTPCTARLHWDTEPGWQTIESQACVGHTYRVFVDPDDVSQDQCNKSCPGGGSVTCEGIQCGTTQGGCWALIDATCNDPPSCGDVSGISEEKSCPV